MLVLTTVAALVDVIVLVLVHLLALFEHLLLLVVCKRLLVIVVHQCIVVVRCGQVVLVIRVVVGGRPTAF